MGLDGSARIAANTKGELAVTESYQRSAPVLFFDSLGRRNDSFGRSGEGPGEFYSVKFLAFGPNDTLFAFQTGRLTVIAPSLDAAESRRLPTSFNSFRFAVMPSGALLFNNYLPSRPAFALIRRMDSIPRFLGPSPMPGARSEPDEQQYHIAPTSSTRFWAVKQYFRYELSLWDTSGTELLRIERNPEWFKPWTGEDRDRRGNLPASEAPILPWVTSARVDANDRLWVLVLVPQEPSPASRSSGPGRHVDTIVEIYDSNSGKLCASLRHDDIITNLLPRHLAYGDRELPDGSIAYEIVRIGITGLPPRGC